ncbi:hypothetical protein [Salinibaculum salinum]|uniref:hypothetical protein n=1 Tax=Salinibaculum salinum TaxID=3131996 RepID=UPI0030EF554A
MDASGSTGQTKTSAVSSTADDTTPDDGISRRTILAALGLGGVGAAGGFALLGGGSSEKTPSVSDPNEDDAFDAFEAVRDAMRASPDHLPARAAALVAEGDADAIFAFVRDELAVDPSHDEEMEYANRTRRWGPRGTLRGGTGTPLDIAETLANLFTDAGYEADVVDVRPRFTAEQVREMLFTPPTRAFDPDLSEDEAARYRDVVGGDATPRALDVGGEESSALAESILDAYPGAGAVDEQFDFGWDRFAKLPIVRVDIDGETTYANPFLPDATLADSGLGETPKIWEDTGGGAYPSVRVALSAATANDRWNPRELVTGEWSAADLPGRQVRVDMLSGIDPFQNPDVRFSDVDTFIPALTVSDPHADAETVQDLSVQGGPVTRSGAALTVDDDGVVYRDGRPVVDPSAAVDPVVVDSVEATVDTARYPNVRLGVTAYDSTGDAVEGLPAAAFEVVDDEPAGISVAATTSAPRVQLLVDRSGSMPSAYAGQAMEDLVGRLRDAITTGHEGARIEQTWTNSDIYTNLAEAAESGANLVVYATDGDVGDELTPGIAEALRAGPPAMMMNVDRLDRSALREMADLSGGTYRMVDGHDDAVATVTEFVDATAADLPSYLLDYTAPTDWAAGDERVATVSVPEGGASTDTEYVVPESTVLPDEFASLQLTVRIGHREVTRTLAGWDPVRDADRPVSEADMDAVAGALFGEHILSFEAAATAESVWLDDILTSKLSVRGLHEAADSGDAEAVRDALDAGFTVTPAELMLLQGPMPDAITDDSHTYQDTLRVVLHQQRPQFGTDQILQHTDALDLTKYRTVADDPERAFRLTAERTARVAVVEDALYDDSAVSILDGRVLVPFWEVAAAWEDDEQRAADARVVEARSGNEVALVADDDGPFAFWTVNVDTGTIAGVLDDGSGGGYSQARTEKLLDELSQVISMINLMALAATKGGALTGAGGFALGVVAAYGQELARLYGQVSLAIAIMNADHINRAVAMGAASLACNIAKDIVIGTLGGDMTPWIENILGAAGGPSIC